MHGLLNVDKPAGMTSRAVVNHVQRLVRPAKIGHAGTLDPLATGVLVICIGSATRLVEYVQRMPKHYRASFLLGRQSDTDDVDGAVIEFAQAPVPSRSEVEAVLPQFVGNIAQRPPDYSAIKVNGRRAYDIARQGAELELAARTVAVYAVDLLRYDYPILELAIQCGSGTYVRSIGRDLGKKLRTGAVMSQLVRTAIGNFSVEDAVDPLHLSSESLRLALQPVRDAVQNLPVIPLGPEECALIHHGRTISRAAHGVEGAAAGFDSADRLIAVLVPHGPDGLRPEKVLIS